MYKILILIVLSFNVCSENRPTNDENDIRLKTVIYRNNDIIPVMTTYKTATLIDLGINKNIDDVFIGDSESWLVDKTSSNTAILIKPLRENSDTNLILISGERKYYFKLHRSERKITYGIKFIYPDEQILKLKNKINKIKTETVNKDLNIDKSFPTDWNFGYILKGSKGSSPLTIFDDNKFTYLDFGKKEIPAIFSVDADFRESVINFHKSGKYIVLENTYRQLTLRNGNTTTCIYNKMYDEIVDANDESLKKLININELDDGKSR